MLQTSRDGKKDEERINTVEHASFTPILLACTGGCIKIATTFIKRLSSLISQNRNLPYSKTVNWIRCRLGFALLRACIMSLSGSRVKYYQRLQHFACKCRRSSCINDGYRLIYIIYNIYECIIVVIVVVVAVAMKLATDHASHYRLQDLGEGFGHSTFSCHAHCHSRGPDLLCPGSIYQRQLSTVAGCRWLLRSHRSRGRFCPSRSGEGLRPCRLVLPRPSADCHELRSRVSIICLYFVQRYIESRCSKPLAVSPYSSYQGSASGMSSVTDLVRLDCGDPGITHSFVSLFRPILACIRRSAESDPVRRRYHRRCVFGHWFRRIGRLPVYIPEGKRSEA